MLLWIILASVLLAILLLLWTNLRICIFYREEWKVQIIFWVLRFRLFPQKEKKPKIKDFSTRRLEKLRKKRIKKKAKAKKKENVVKKQPKKQLDAKELLTLVQDIRQFFSDLPQRVARVLRLRVGRIELTVGTEDAARTAMLTGVVTESVRGIEAFLNEQIHYQRKRHAVVAVVPDFTHSTCAAKIEIELRIRLFFALSLGVHAFYSLLQFKNRDSNHKEAIK